MIQSRPNGSATKKRYHENGRRHAKISKKLQKKMHKSSAKSSPGRIQKDQFTGHATPKTIGSPPYVIFPTS
jgi:hypothetical protein